METVKQGAATLLNSRFNKAIYTGVVGAAVDFLFGLLAEFSIDVSASLQTKTLILAMAITTLLVKNKEGNQGESNMRKSSNIGMIVLAAMLGAGLFLTGCASNLADNPAKKEKVERTASSIGFAMETLSYQGLRFLNQKTPEQVPGAIEDIDAAVASLQRYEDGDIDLAEVGQSITELLDRLNERFFFIQDENNRELLFIAIGSVSHLISTHITAIDVAEETTYYLEAAREGLKSGKELYIERHPGEGSE